MQKYKYQYIAGAYPKSCYRKKINNNDKEIADKSNEFHHK